MVQDITSGITSQEKLAILDSKMSIRKQLSRICRTLNSHCQVFEYFSSGY